MDVRRLSTFHTRAVLLLALVLPAEPLRFQCRLASVCSIANWNPREEGTFVLSHIPDNYSEVILTNLLASSVDSSFLEDQFASESRLRSLTIRKSALRSFTLKDNSRLKFLSLERTYVSTVSFGTGNTVQLLTVVSSRLGQLPPSIARLQKLAILTVNRSLLKAINLDVIGGLADLKRLDLSRNLISALYYRAKPELYPVLSDVYLRENRLRSITTELFNCMPALATLDLSHNHIGVVSGSLSTSSLTALDLSYNRIQRFDCCRWTIPNIASVLLVNGGLRQLPDCMERAFANVTSLHFDHNQLHRDEMWRFVGFPNLRVLSLLHNNLCRVSLDERTLPPSLAFLDLSFNNLQQVDVRYVPNDEFFPALAYNCITRLDWDRLPANLSERIKLGNPFDCTSASQPNPDFLAKSLSRACSENIRKCENAHGQQCE